MKDFYTILGISPKASQDDIKKSYRKLVLKYHPDKHAGNRLYEAKFREIHEAYRVLGEVKKREDYDFRAFNKVQKYETSTPKSLVKQAEELRTKILLEDPDRMNTTALYRQVLYLISDYNVGVLLEKNEPAINKKLVEELLVCSSFLHLELISEICLKLSAIAGADNELQQEIFRFSKNAGLRHYQQLFKIPVMIFLSFLLCFFIYWIARGR